MDTPPRTPHTTDCRTDSTSPSSRRPQPRPPSPANALEVQLEALVVSRCGVDAVLPRHRATHRVDWFPAATRAPRARRNDYRDAT
ncbi:hypothetical protein GCM10028771_26590 [Nocardioides marmoraquaticus]